jgi:hypothetical protein
VNGWSPQGLLNQIDQGQRPSEEVSEELVMGQAASDSVMENGGLDFNGQEAETATTDLIRVGRSACRHHELVD